MEEAKSYYEKKLKALPDGEARIFNRETVPPLENLKRIHLIGVCGTAMGSLAGLLVEAGYSVSGSDEGVYPPMDKQIKDLGIQFFSDFNANNLEGADLVIVGNFAGPNNIEASYARLNNVPTLSSAEALEYFFLPNKKSLVVAGTHGKTTTSGLLAHIFQSAGTDPTYLIGGIIKNYDKSYRYGKGQFVIVEGDEYDTAYFDKEPKFLHYHATSAIVTSLEFDHIDIYTDMADYTTAFKFLVNDIPEDGNLILWGDDPSVRNLAKEAKANLYFYGLKGNNDIEAKNIKVKEDHQQFALYVKGKELGLIRTHLPGEHNLLNVLAVAGISIANGLSFDKLRDGVESFKGMKRRQEVIFDKGITVIDDFAHHPTAVRETIAAIREKYGKRRLVVFFEPRSNTSRRKLFEKDYGESFDRADKVYLSVPPLRHNDTREDFIDEEKVVYTINERAGDLAKATFFPNANALLETVRPVLERGDVVLIMSNGSFDGIHWKLITGIMEL